MGVTTPPVGRDSVIGDASRLVATRYVRPKTHNSLDVSPQYGARGAKAMQQQAKAGQHERTSWRTWAHDMAKAALEDGLADVVRGPVVIEVVHFRVNRAGIPDAGSPFRAAKALIDGLADAGIFPDGDGPDVVTYLGFRAPLIRGIDGLQVIVDAVPAAQTALPI